MRKSPLLFFLLFCASGFLSAQKTSFSALGAGINRFGFSFHFRHYGEINPNNNNFKPILDWGIELGNVQHPREVALLNTTFQNSGVYKLDKVNYNWNIRPSVFFRKPIYNRNDRKTVGMSGVLGAGIPLALIWPVYVNVLQVDGSGNQTFARERYNPDVHPQSQINGRASFANGMGEMSFIPGLSAQAGLEFSWGSFRSEANILGFGLRVEAFPKKIPILHTAALNKAVFASFYLNFAFGLGN